MFRALLFLASSFLIVACTADATREETASRSSKQEVGEGTASCPSLFGRFCDESDGRAIVREYSVYGLRHPDGSCRYWGGTEEQALDAWPRYGPNYGDPTGGVEICESTCESSRAKIDAHCL